MGKPERVDLSAYSLASEILHSFTLEFLANDAETDIEAILVASERNQFVRAITIPRADWIGLLRSIVDDRVQEVSVQLGSDGRSPQVKIC